MQNKILYNFTNPVKHITVIHIALDENGEKEGLTCTSLSHITNNPVSVILLQSLQRNSIPIKDAQLAPLNILFSLQITELDRSGYNRRDKIYVQREGVSPSVNSE